MNTEKHKAGFPTQSANHSTPNVNRPSPNTNHQISRTKSCGLQRCHAGVSFWTSVLPVPGTLLQPPFVHRYRWNNKRSSGPIWYGSMPSTIQYAPTQIPVPALYRKNRNFVARTCLHCPAQEHQCWPCGPGQSPKHSVILEDAALGPQITPPRLRGEPWGTPSVEVRSNRLLARTSRQSLATPVNRFRVYDTGYRFKA